METRFSCEGWGGTSRSEQGRSVIHCCVGVAKPRAQAQTSEGAVTFLSFWRVRADHVYVRGSNRICDPGPEMPSSVTLITCDTLDNTGAPQCGYFNAFP